MQKLSLPIAHASTPKKVENASAKATEGLEVSNDAPMPFADMLKQHLTHQKGTPKQPQALTEPASTTIKTDHKSALGVQLEDNKLALEAHDDESASLVANISPAVMLQNLINPMANPVQQVNTPANKTQFNQEATVATELPVLANSKSDLAKPTEALIATLDGQATTSVNQEALTDAPTTLTFAQQLTQLTQANALQKTQPTSAELVQKNNALTQQNNGLAVTDNVVVNANQPITKEDTLPLKQTLEAINPLKEVTSQAKQDVAVITPNVTPSMLNTPVVATAVNAIIPGNEIATPFASAGWHQEVNQKVVWMVGGSEQSATLTLNPPDLGPLQVVVSVNNDFVDTTFISDNPDVRNALQDGMEMLRHKMSESGIQLGNANINSGEQSQRAFQQANQSQQGRSASASAQQTTQQVEADIKPIKAAKTLVGLVNTFA